MKTFALSLLLIFFSFSMPFAQTFEVELINPYFSAGKIKDACFLDDKTGWLASEARLFSTQDSGRTWVEKNMSPLLLSNVYFMNSEVGYIMGEKYESEEWVVEVLKTTDGGENWNEVLQFTNTTPLKIIFFTDTKGIVYAWDKAFFTEDGGESWTEREHDRYFTDVEFYNQTIGYATGEALTIYQQSPDPEEPPIESRVTAVYKTNDGGITWEIGESCSVEYDELNSLQVIDSDNAIAGGSLWTMEPSGAGSSSAGSLISTSNGGENWCTEGSIDLTAKHISDIMNFNRDTAFALTNHLELLYTFDRWQTSSSIQIKRSGDPTYGNMAGQLAKGNNSLFIYGEKGLFARIPDYRLPEEIERMDGYGSNTFRDLYETMNRIDFAGCNIYTNYENQTSNFYSTDCGATWTLNPVSTGPHPMDLKFTGELNGYKVNSNGFYRTNDAGLTWNEDKSVDFSIIENTADLYFFDNFGLLHTDTFLYTSQNSGASWQKVLEDDSLSQLYVYDESLIFYFNSEERSEKIYRSADKGNHWEEIYLSEDSIVIYDIQFLDENTGFVAGIKQQLNSRNTQISNGIILVTHDGGDTWARYGGRLLDFATYGPSDIHFTDEETGYFINSDQLYRTTDGGSTWDVNITGTFPLTTLKLYQDSILYIGGKLGFLGRTKVPENNIITQIQEEQTEINEVDLNIYPNPAGNKVNIRSGLNQLLRVEVYSHTGKLVTIAGPLDQEELVTINTAGLKPGVYILKMVGERKIWSEKLVVK